MKFKSGFPVFLKLPFMLSAKTLWYILTLLLASLTTLCFYPAALASELKIALQDDPDMLDPALAKTFSGRLVYMAMCDRLIDLSQDMQFIPGLAKNWNFSEDGKILAMNLRKNVLFHDGTPFNADAAVYSLKRSMAFSKSLRDNEMASVKDIEATGPFEITITLKYADAALLSYLAGRAGIMVSPKAAREMGGDFGLKPICAGPFRFVERVARDRIVLEKFDRYWNKDVIRFDHITFLSIEDPMVRFSNLRSGIVDLIDRLSAGDQAKTKMSTRLATDTISGNGYFGLVVNMATATRPGTPLGQEKLLRQAFSLAIDRAAIRDIVFGGSFAIGNQPWAPDTIWFNLRYPVLPRNIEKARQLVKQAGFEGKEIDVQISHSNDPVILQAMQLVKTMVGDAGFNVTLLPKEAAKLDLDNEKGNFSVAAQIWSGRVDPDGNVSRFITCDGDDNIGKYCNRELDKVLSSARQQQDPDQRADFYHQASAILTDELPIIYLGYPSYSYAYTRKLHGFEPYPDGIIRFSNMYKD
ncbi:ABC transporter substrate-binding protein [uncultured Bartonella sp.]|uniref:ABC transporter substrate-binding protein n=1 Tax=uncultured Bartonella sp. TaxID=104108 RepID=UPI00262ACF57|nr:ABC transporter substrate-binding protein [uncultured Bartonella sp.]